jgi:type I restriction enzyme S subunit
MPDPTTELLQKHFDLALEAPDGIAKLRELILTLAMQGKLVPQDPNDPPASELLKEIESEKALLISGRSRSKLQTLSGKSLGRSKALPEGWALTTIGACTLVTMGQSPESSSYNNLGYVHAFG